MAVFEARARAAWGIGGGRGENGAQVRILHVVGACVGREDPAGRKPLHRAQVDLLVSPKGALERGL